METHVRYKLKYKVTTNNESLRAESNVAVKDDGFFDHLWTRICSSPSKKITKFDIVRPGERETQHLRRYVLLFQNLCISILKHKD